MHSVARSGFVAAREDGELVGYAIFVPSLKQVQRSAVLSGAVFRWSWNTVRRGELRWSTLFRIVRNKALFIRTGRRFRTRGDAQLINVAVDPAAQGRGIAQQLVARGLHEMRALGVPEVRLEVRPWNAAAVAVYERTGWRRAGTTRDLQGEWTVMVATNHPA